MAEKPRIRVPADARWTRKAVRQAPIHNVRASYEAAGNGERASGWSGATAIGPVSVIGQSLDTLRNRCRFELRNNPAAAPIPEFVVDSVSGGRIWPNIRDEGLKNVFEAWAVSAASDGQDLLTLIDTAVEEWIAGGEAFLRKRFRDPRFNPELALPFQIQILPGEMCPTRDLSFESVSGIVLDGADTPTAYRFYRRHPNEQITQRGGQPVSLTDLATVPASEISHLYIPHRAGQIRGEPWLTRNLIPLHDLDAFLDAELVRKKMTAMHVFTLETPARDETQEVPADYDAQGNPLDEDGSPWAPSDPMDYVPDLKAGAMFAMKPGYTLKSSNPASVGGDFDPFVVRQQMRICSSIGVPWEMVFGDIRNISDRMWRAKLLIYERRVRRWRRILHQKVLRWIMKQVVDEAILAGVWTPPAGTEARDFYDVEWVAEPMGHIYPKQEAEADILEVQAGFKSWRKAVRERGGDPERLLDEIDDWNRMLDQRGLVLRSDRRTDLPGFQPEDDEDDG